MGLFSFEDKETNLDDCKNAKFKLERIILFEDRVIIVFIQDLNYQKLNKKC